MSLIGLVHLAERLFNSTQGNPNDEAGAAGRSAKNGNAQGSSRTQSDEFRPSGGNSSTDAGLFQVKQQSVFTAAATEILLVQGGATANGATAATTPGSAANQADAQSAGTNNAVTSQTAPQVTGSTATTAASDNAQVLAQLQSLNSALAALGLSSAEIAAVDRVAQFIQDFSPAAYTSLINQLQVLAQDSAQTTPANGTNASNVPDATGSGTTGGFSIEELSIKFAGINETVQQGGNTLQISAFQLQVSEVNLTLNNAATGQTAQIQAPQAAGTATTSAPLAKSAAA